MLPEDLQPEEIKYKEVSSFGVLPVIEQAKKSGARITAKDIAYSKKEIYYRVRHIFTSKIYNSKTKSCENLYKINDIK